MGLSPKRPSNPLKLGDNIGTIYFKILSLDLLVV